MFKLHCLVCLCLWSVAPMKALVTERYLDWRQRLAPLNLTCAEITGDTEHDDITVIRNSQVCTRVCVCVCTLLYLCLFCSFFFDQVISISDSAWSGCDVVFVSSQVSKVMFRSCELEMMEMFGSLGLVFCSLVHGFQTKVRIEKLHMAIIRRIKFICLKYVGYKVRNGKNQTNFISYEHLFTNNCIRTLCIRTISIRTLVLESFCSLVHIEGSEAYSVWDGYVWDGYTCHKILVNINIPLSRHRWYWPHPRSGTFSPVAGGTTPPSCRQCLSSSLMK